MLFFSLLSSLAFAEPLQVGVTNSPPFSMQVDGEWEGISVDLWEKIADENSWEYQYVETDLAGLLDGAENGKLDASISSLTITAEREAVMDFTTPYYTETLGVATTRSPSAFERRVSQLWAAGKAFGSLLFLVFGVGSVYFLIERRHSLSNSFSGWINSGYWSTATVTTVGYGDEAPKRIAGRLFAIFWMLCGFIALGWVTAMFGDIFEAGEEFAIDHPQELRNYDVATIGNSSSSKFLKNNRVRHIEVATVGELRDDLLSPNTATDFVIYDRTILLYTFADDPSVDVLNVQYDEQHFGFALPTGSELSEPLNVGILTHTNTEWWDNAIFTYTN